MCEHRKYMDEELLKFERRQKEIMAKVDLPDSPVREPRDFPTPPRVYNPWDDYAPQDHPFGEDVELDYGDQEILGEEEEEDNDDDTDSDSDGDGDDDE